MASIPVPVRQAVPAPVGGPDSWRSLRSEMDRLFDRFTSGFGMSLLPMPALGSAPAMPADEVRTAA